MLLLGLGEPALGGGPLVLGECPELPGVLLVAECVRACEQLVADCEQLRR